MEFKQLEYFVCVAELSSFTKAAQKLFLSQPALSKTIKSLEAEIGTKLLKRDNKQLQLTPTGQKVYLKAKECVAAYNQFTTMIDNLKNTKEGQVVVGVPPGIASCVLAPVLQQFYATYPNIKLKFVEEGGHDVDKWLANGDIEVAITIMPLDNPEFTVYPLVQDTYALVIHQGHPLCEYDTLTGSDLHCLDGQNFVAFAPRYKSYSNNQSYLSKHGINPVVTTTEVSYDLMARLASLKTGFTILPRRVAVLVNPEGIKVIPIQDHPWNVVLAYKKNAGISSVQKLFIDFIHKNMPLSSPV